MGTKNDDFDKEYEILEKDLYKIVTNKENEGLLDVCVQSCKRIDILKKKIKASKRTKGDIKEHE